MGSGYWDSNVYDARASYRASSGKSAFDYSDSMTRSPRSSWKIHKTLDPNGVRVRECRDSGGHPNSLAISVFFDVTGSMGGIPRQLQKKLPELLGLLKRKGYVEHPQIMFGAIGDATCDTIPLQVGQFESDNRMDENLENFILEGGGGGQMTESYELAMYFMAKHTVLDCLQKRRKKGYLFIIGDEMAYGQVKADEVKTLIGDNMQSDISLSQMVRELQQKFEVFFLLPRGASHGGSSQVLSFWRKLFGQNVIELDDPNAVCEVIALQIGLAEGTIDLDDGLNHLKEFGVKSSTINTVSKALARYKGRSSIAKTSGSLGLSGDPNKNTKRL
jgi:hypothetical protein